MSISFHTDGVAFDQKNCDGKIAEFRPTPKNGRNRPFLPYHVPWSL